MRTIVIGYDGSESAGRALERVSELAVDGAKVILVSATRTTSGPRAGSADPVDHDEHAAAAEQAKARLAELGVEAELAEGVGEPADVILEAAKEAGADLIVVGTEHKNLIERLFQGSVSSGVTHKAECDVLVVP